MRGEQRGGEGCSWEQDTCTSLQGQHTDARRGQGGGVPSAAQDACTSSQDHHNTCCVSAQDYRMCSCSPTSQEQERSHSAGAGDPPLSVKMLFNVSSEQWYQSPVFPPRAGTGGCS